MLSGLFPEFETVIMKKNIYQDINKIPLIPQKIVMWHHDDTDIDHHVTQSYWK